MNHQTIIDVYARNDEIREKTKQVVSVLSNEQVSSLPEGEKWTIAEIVEHMAIVQDGMTRISAKLLNQAKTAGKASDGMARFSENFVAKAAELKQLKLEAPDRVRPTGIQTIEESLRKMDETRHALEALRPLFESIECADFKFPHPFLGNLTAYEWLALVGEHEARHLKQIENRLKNEN